MISRPLLVTSTLIGLALCFVPLLGVHGVESAVALGATLPPCAPPPPPAWSAACAWGTDRRTEETRAKSRRAGFFGSSVRPRPDARR